MGRRREKKKSERCPGEGGVYIPLEVRPDHLLEIRRRPKITRESMEPRNGDADNRQERPRLGA